MSWSPFIEAFNPGYKHTVEEQRRKQVEAQIPGSGGNPLGVDLDKGIVRITLPPKDGDTEAESPEAAGSQDDEPLGD
ncbi:MAG TPA: DUF6191 domain-containing protein [Segeticoccus sp.]|jgi:hypothetical protein|nr:DUF6191 domain-containing protein [Segeticoccus sp.]